MYKLKLTTFYFLSSALLIIFSGCEEDFIKNQEIASRTSTTGFKNGEEGIGGFTDYPNGQRVAYPTIVKKTFIPANSLFADMKCLTWKITWPAYPAATDPEKIPTVLRTSNGALNSIYYLNNIHPQNTLTTDFSLYHNDKIEAAVMMWEELDHRDLNMESVFFYKTDKSVATIEEWVKERPQLFQHYWVDSIEMEADYQAGDIFLFNLSKKGQYGGIRIVSMTPRVIEVYLAVPN